MKAVTINQQPKTLAEFKAQNQELQEQIKRLKKKLAMSNSSFLNIVGKSLDGIVIVDRNRMVVYTNYAAINLFDRNIADLLGEPLDLDFDPNDLLSQNEVSTEIHITKADGSDSVAEVSVMQTEWNNEPAFVVSFRDITERKKSEELLEYMSQHDYLTDLPNRIHFEAQLSDAIRDSEDKSQHMALLYVDLDGFKGVNDTLGHDAGDLVLKETSRILCNCLRRGDTVARLGGDEFAVILKGLVNPAYSDMIASRILKALDNAYVFEGQDIHVKASIGIATYPFAGVNEIELLKNADVAMYKAKKAGKNRYCYFSKEMNQQHKRRLQIRQGLYGIANAKRQKELFLEYQPLIDVQTQECIGVEALVRWQHPELGIILPDDFLPVVEDAAQMQAIGRWVVKHALKDYQTLPQDLLFSINISIDELAINNTITALLAKTVAANHVDPRQLVLEITERSVIQELDIMIQQFEAFTETGIKIAIDDFGTGHGSLSNLKDLPIAIIKLDNVFIQDMTREDDRDNRSNSIIVRSSIELAHKLGVKVVAEGVETEQQARLLQQYECDYAQGFYFAKPMSLAELKQYLITANSKKAG